VQDFAVVFNEALKAYELSPVRSAPNAVIEKEFWSNPAVQQLPYQRGMLLAMHWDAAVQRATQGRKRLDDVLHEMQRRAAADGRLRAVVLLAQAMQSVGGVDIAADLMRYVERGEVAPVTTDLFAGCGSVHTIDRPAFHRGFDIDRTSANGDVIAGVVAGGPAERAGLRNGMKLIARRAGEIGDSTREIAYEVMDAGQTRTLRWMPEGTGRAVFRQLKLSAAAALPACTKQLGG
jgi:predicted metalloprotease with PDZ domain